METYVDIFINADGENISVIHNKMIELGLKPTIGEHDFVYNWKGITNIEEEIRFIEVIQNKLKGTGVLLKFTTVR